MHPVAANVLALVLGVVCARGFKFQSSGNEVKNKINGPLLPITLINVSKNISAVSLSIYIQREKMKEII